MRLRRFKGKFPCKSEKDCGPVEKCINEDYGSDDSLPKFCNPSYCDSVDDCRYSYDYRCIHSERWGKKTCQTYKYGPPCKIQKDCRRSAMCGMLNHCMCVDNHEKDAEFPKTCRKIKDLTPCEFDDECEDDERCLDSRRVIRPWPYDWPDLPEHLRPNLPLPRIPPPPKTCQKHFNKWCTSDKGCFWAQSQHDLFEETCHGVHFPCENCAPEPG